MVPDTKKSRLLLAAVSGLLLSLPWFQWHVGWVLLVAFVPLLLIEDFFYEQRQSYGSIQVFWYAYLSFFIWNLLTTWWIYFATDFGAVAAIVLNALFVAVVFWLAHLVKRHWGRFWGQMAFVFFWIAFEYIYLHGKISWPWLTLGNGFANTTMLVQWYEYTGILGGSLWVLVANSAIVVVYKNNFWRRAKRTTVFLVLWLLLPWLWSWWLYLNAENYNNGRKIAVVVVQPNVDPYHEKFGSMSSQEQIARFLSLADSLVDDDVKYVVGPETAIPVSIFENSFDDYPVVEMLRKFAEKHSQLNILIGASTYRLYPQGQKTSTARLMKSLNQYYDAFNTALSIDCCDTIQIYHKSKLVIGVEEIPYVKYFKPLEKLAINLGGSMMSLATQRERTVFVARNDTVKAAPIICYESIYGEFVTGYVKNGAHFLAVITNDGWWRDTPGYKQHFSFSALRAIETRRYVVRSANTGISGIIDAQGRITKKTQWWQQTAFYAWVPLNTVKTFYVRHGDYIGRFAMWGTLIIFVMMVWFRFLKK